MDATVSLEHSLAQVLTALAQYEAVLRRNRAFPSDLDVVDAGEPGEVPDSGDRMKLTLEVASECPSVRKFILNPSRLRFPFADRSL